MMDKWYDIYNVGGNIAEILIYDTIGMNGITAKAFANEFKTISNSKRITVKLNTIGGSVIDGNAIYTILKNSTAQINIEIEGVALSMGSIIAMAGRHVSMADNGFMMIHNPQGIAEGDSNEMLKTVDVMQKVKKTMIQAYQKKTGLDDKTLSDMMDAETWLTASEALELGFIDEISNAVELVASFDYSEFNRLPDALQKITFNNSTDTSTVENKDIAKMTDKTTKTNLEKTTKTTLIDTTAIAEQTLLAEKNRRTEIRAVYNTVGQDHLELLNQCLDDSTIDINTARTLLLDALGKEATPIATNHAIKMGADSRDKFMTGAMQAISARTGQEKRDSKSEFNGATLLDFAKASLRVSNVNTSGMSKMQIVGAAFTHTTSDFPLLLENSITKTLQAAYGNFAETWTSIATTSSVPDFKINPRIRLGSFNSLDLIPEGAEYKSGTFSEESATIKAQTKGKLISFTRQAIINDDLNGFTRLAQMFGRAAARTVGNDVYNLLLANAPVFDGNPLFHASHKNLATKPSAMSVVSLGAARTAMRMQKDLDNNDYLDIRPSILLVPVALEDTATVLMASETDPAQSNSRTPNAIRGMATIVSDPRLDGNSTTAWYLLASPNDVPSLEVAFLDGNQTPYLETQDGFNVDGFQMKVRLDYGVAATDFRGLRKNPGA